MKRPTTWAVAFAAIAMFGGCSDQYADVGSVDVSAAKGKAAETGAVRGPAAKGREARPPAMPPGR